MCCRSSLPRNKISSLVLGCRASAVRAVAALRCWQLGNLRGHSRSPHGILVLVVFVGEEDLLAVFVGSDQVEGSWDHEQVASPSRPADAVGTGVRCGGRPGAAADPSAIA